MGVTGALSLRKLSTAAMGGGSTCRTSCGPPGDACNNPCRRQADEVVARGSTGPSCWLRTTIGASGRTPISSRRIAWRRRRRRVVLSTRAHARIDVSVGEGFARPRSGQSRDVRPRPPVCARCRPRLRSSARAQTARSYVVRSRGESPRLRDDRSSRRARCRAPSPAAVAAAQSLEGSSARAGSSSRFHLGWWHAVAGARSDGASSDRGTASCGVPAASRAERERRGRRVHVLRLRKRRPPRV